MEIEGGNRCDCSKLELKESTGRLKSHGPLSDIFLLLSSSALITASNPLINNVNSVLEHLYASLSMKTHLFLHDG